MFGFFWMAFFWACLAAIGLLCNIALFAADKRNGSVLSKVIKGEMLTDLITSPP